MQSLKIKIVKREPSYSGKADPQLEINGQTTKMTSYNFSSYYLMQIDKTNHSTYHDLDEAMMSARQIRDMYGMVGITAEIEVVSVDKAIK